MTTTPDGLGNASDVTDDPRINAAIARLRDAHGRPAVEHVEVYEDVHQRLQAALVVLDDEI